MKTYLIVWRELTRLNSFIVNPLDDLYNYVQYAYMDEIKTWQQNAVNGSTWKNPDGSMLVVCLEDTYEKWLSEIEE